MGLGAPFSLLRMSRAAQSGSRDSLAHRTRRLFPHRFAVRRSQQRRVPHQPGVRRRPHQVISPAKTSTGFERDSSSAISGFRSLCGRKQRSSFSHRAQFDLRFGTFHSGRALVLRTLASIRICLRSQQPWTDVDRNVVAPGEYSKCFFCIPIRLYRDLFWKATALWIPARSA